MADTEIAFVFDKDRGLIETRVPRTDGGASVTIVGTLSASVLQGSGSGGGGGSFPLDPVPTVGSLLITDTDGNPTSAPNIFSGPDGGLDISTLTDVNYGLDISTTSGTNYGINITSTTGYNYGLEIRKTGAGANYGIKVTSTNTADNQGISLTSVSGDNSGLTISSGPGRNYGITISSTSGGSNSGILISSVTTGDNSGLNITSVAGINYGVNVISTTGTNQGIEITSTTGTNYGLKIQKTGAGTNYGITISASGGATSNGLTITGGSGGVTVDGVNIVPLAINAHYPLVQSAHTSATRTLALADSQDIIPLSAASNAIEVTIPHSLFASGGTGRAFECRLRAMSVAGGAITFVGSGGIVITYHGKNPGTTPIVAGDFIRVVVTSATSADVWVDAVAV